MPDALLVGLIGFLAAIVGGIIQTTASRRLAATRFQQENRNQAYLSFCSGIGKLSFPAHDAEEHRRALAAVAEARFRVALCGSEDVVKAMIDVVAQSDVRSVEAQHKIAHLIDAMRRDCLPSRGMTDPHLLYVLTYGDPEMDRK